MVFKWKTAPAARTTGAREGYLPVLAWLSLAELLSSIARVRFTRQFYCTKDNAEVTREDSHKIDYKNST